MTEEVNQEANRAAQADAQSASLQATNQLIAHARGELGKVISGQRTAIEEVLIAVSARAMRCSKACRALPKR
jgi:hypothetical protein